MPDVHDLMGDEERSDEYLRQHPAQEVSLWQEWVLVVCRQRAMPVPTGPEWDELMKTWHHNKMPLTSVDELAEMRKRMGVQPDENKPARCA